MNQTAPPAHIGWSVILYRIVCYTIDTLRKGGRLVSEAQKRAKAKYDLKTAQFMFRLRIDDDADVIEKLRKVKNKTEFIRELIRRDIRENTNVSTHAPRAGATKSSNTTD